MKIVEKNICYRNAAISDCSHIVRLYSIASDGIANYVWSTMAAPGQDLEEVGVRRYQREDTIYSYLNCIMADVDNQVAGMMLSYPMQVDKDENYSDYDPVLLPYVRLEEDNSYYISGMAIYPEFRGKGIGTRFMALAEQRATEQGYDKLSLIVVEENTTALNLYKKTGYYEAMRQAIVPHPLIHCIGDAMLMVKQLSTS